MSTNSHSTSGDQPLHPTILSPPNRKEPMTADAVSIASSTTLRASPSTFTPTKTLSINTPGIALWKPCNTPSSRCITITNPDGSIAYTSARSNPNSGTCTLASASGAPLLETTYFFGPGRDPVLTTLDSNEDDACEIKTRSKWMSRGHKFECPDGRTLEWRYTKAEAGAGGKKRTALVLEVGGRRVAMLVRNEDTRTLGSKAWSAGNGGELLLSEEVGGKMGVGEEIVVASCLVMLKKEVDRRKCVQLAVMAAVVV